MIVVSDTSPVTSLITIGRIELLPTIFGQVFIPPCVQAELLRGHGVLPPGFQVASVRHPDEVEALLPRLDRGEAEAIVLAKELRADLLLMDERDGRERAKLAGLRTMGLMGVLLVAKRRGLIESVAAVAAELRQQASFRVADAVLEAVLRDAGE